MRLCKRERTEHEEADQWRKENQYRKIIRKINRKYITNAYFARKRKKERERKKEIRKERMKQSERKIETRCYSVGGGFCDRLCWAGE